MDDDTNSQKNNFDLFYKARQTRFIVWYQRPLPLRPATSTVIIAFQAMTRLLLMAVVPYICRVYITFASMINE